MEMAEGQNQLKIAPKQIKSNEIMEEVEEDRISVLPDCLLLEILSRLPSTKCAIRTGTLSKRWEHLWTWVPTLNFERNFCNQFGSDFVLMVSKTLAQCRQLKLKKFRVSTSYDIRFESQLNNLIQYAISCNVEEFNLTLWNLKWGVNKFLLDQLFFTNSCFTDITLAGCVFDLTEAITWKNLRSLSISYGYLNEELIEKILLGSPLLETMELVYCYGYRRLDITSKSLKNLVISGYEYDYEYEYDDMFDIIEINAPNILFLTIQDDLVLEDLLLLNVSSLVKANLDYINVWPYEIMKEDMLKGFILNLCHVKELKIGVFCSKVLSRLEAKGFIFPSNMKFPDVTHLLYS